MVYFAIKSIECVLIITNIIFKIQNIMVTAYRDDVQNINKTTKSIFMIFIVLF